MTKTTTTDDPREDRAPRSAVVAYATLFGATEYVAEVIARELRHRLGSQVKVVDLGYASAEDLEGHDLLVVGACTWNVGQLPPDLESNLEMLAGLRLEGRAFALFGTGDQIGYPDTFVDAIGDMANALRSTGARLVGRWPTDGYDFVASRGLVGDELLGLALDEDNEPQLTEERVRAWTTKVAAEMGLSERVTILSR